MPALRAISASSSLLALLAFTMFWLAIFAPLLAIMQALGGMEHSQAALLSKANILSAAGAFCALGVVVFAWMAAGKAAALRWSRMHAEILESQLLQAERSRDEYRTVLACELRRETIGLTQLVNAAKDAVSPVLKEKSHRFSISLPREPVWLHADSAHMIRLLSLLLQYAARNSADKSTIACNAQHTEGRIKIEIGNDGGAPAQVPKLSGNELAYARIMAELHDGYMDACGKEQVCAFTLWLPPASASAYSVERALQSAIADGNEGAARRIG